MTPSLQEQATINFYSWEARARGYILNDSPVEIEPPYIPFVPVSQSSNDGYDDGRVPSLFSQALKLFKKPEQKDEEIPEILPSVIERSDKRKAYSLFFPKGTEIQTILIQEVLHLLCYSEDSFSFEILAQEGSIQILFTASLSDSFRLKSQLAAFFPTLIIKEIAWNDIYFDLDKPVAIADFGLENEFMLPTESTNSYSIDPLTSIIATLSHVKDDEVALFQVLFQGVTAPWAQDALYASSDSSGGSFFEGSPSFINGVHEKVSSPLFGVVMRIAVQGKDEQTSRYISSELARNIKTVSTSEYNSLIPLSNEGYDYEEHLKNVYYRSSNRLGFILNSQELTHFVHYPNRTVICEKLGLIHEKSKRANIPSNKGVYLGENVHNGESYPVHLDTESRLSHTHIIGTTGVGKSTLIANMILGDIEVGRGSALFDPHGDIVEDILVRIPEHRKDDVIVIDPSDSEFPIGFNILEAKTEAEKIVLSSDIVSAFKRHATAWGDTMTAVLQNAVNTILESARGGTLIELKRFLIEDRYRNEYLTSVDDPSLHYYWNNEYYMVKKKIAPLLTRIDTFLRPKLVRYMLAQKKGVDITDCLQNNKVVLLKLSQGLIGEQNSYLLGSLFLAKFNQAALGRQPLSKEERTPYMLYLDEFQNFITPSIERILSGARKYGLGLTIVHQELGQIEDTKLLNSVLSNPKTRICFRLGDNDAKRLESGFSYFKREDLQNLGVGETIMRVGSLKNDCNVKTLPLKDIEVGAESIKTSIINNTRNQYAISKTEIEKILKSLLPKNEKRVKSGVKREDKKLEIEENFIEKKTYPIKERVKISEKNEEQKTIFQEEVKELIQQQEDSKRIKDHQYLQQLVRKMGQEYGFLATIEKELIDGKRIDITLEREFTKIAVECAVNNSVEYEIKNIKKALNHKYNPIIILSKNRNHLDKIKKRGVKEFSKKELEKIKFIQPQELSNILLQYVHQKITKKEIIKGYRVTTEYESDKKMNARNIRESIAKKLFRKK